LEITRGDVLVPIAAAPIGRVSTTLENIVLDRPYTLEFLPLTEGNSTPDGLKLNTYVVTASGGRLVSSDDLVPMGPLNGDFDRVLGLLASPVSVDLSSYTGQTVALRWAVEPTSSEQPTSRSYVAGFRLRLAEPTSVELPNILMVCSDAHRYDFALGKEGRELMPNLQRLVAQSLVYDRAFSTSSWTLPSIASIFTGLPPRYHQAGRRTGQLSEDGETNPSGTEFSVDWGAPPFEKIVLTRFPRELNTLAESLQTIGYSTAFVASNPLYHASNLLVEGADFPVFVPTVPGDNGGGAKVNGIARDVLQVLLENNPVFLVVHYLDVHQWEPRYYRRDHPGSHANGDSRDVVLASYSEAVRDADRFLGELLDLWRDSRSFDESLIVVFADHGEHLLDPGLGHGNTMEDELLHVPLVVKYPRSAGVAAGQRVSRPVSLMDLMPTILQLVDSPVGLPTLAGRSLLNSGAEMSAGSRPLFADFQLYGDELASVRRGDFKLVVDLDEHTSSTTQWRSGEGSAAEIARQTALLAESMAEYDRLASEVSSKLEIAPADASKAIEALRSLGYVQ